jgi:hypothetical protein
LRGRVHITDRNCLEEIADYGIPEREYQRLLG